MQITSGIIDAQGNPKFKISHFPLFGSNSIWNLFLNRPELEEQTLNEFCHNPEYRWKIFECTRKEFESNLADISFRAEVGEPQKAFALGSAITNFVGSMPNSLRHGKRVFREQLMDDPLPKSLLEKYGDCPIKYFRDDGKDRGQNDDMFRIRGWLSGILCYAAALDLFRLGHLQICGAGLRYGVFFMVAVAPGEWEKIRLISDEE